MTQNFVPVTAAPPQSPDLLDQLVSSILPHERARIRALNFTSPEAVALRSEVVNFIQLFEDSLRDVHVRLGQLLFVANQHAANFDNIDGAIAELQDQIGGDTISREAAQNVAIVATSLITLAEGLLRGEVPTVTDEGVRKTLGEQVALAREVLVWAEDSVAPDDGDESEGEEGSEDAEESDGEDGQ